MPVIHGKDTAEAGEVDVKLDGVELPHSWKLRKYVWVSTAGAQVASFPPKNVEMKAPPMVKPETLLK